MSELEETLKDEMGYADTQRSCAACTHCEVDRYRVDIPGDVFICTIAAPVIELTVSRDGQCKHWDVAVTPLAERERLQPQKIEG